MAMLAAGGVYKLEVLEELVEKADGLVEQQQGERCLWLLEAEHVLVVQFQC